MAHRTLHSCFNQDSLTLRIIEKKTLEQTRKSTVFKCLRIKRLTSIYFYITECCLFVFMNDFSKLFWITSFHLVYLTLPRCFSEESVALTIIEKKSFNKEINWCFRRNETKTNWYALADSDVHKKTFSSTGPDLLLKCPHFLYLRHLSTFNLKL